MFDKLHEECGVVGVYGHPEAANLVYLGLYALQHRGQESSGIVSSHKGKLHLEIGMGLVADVFNTERLKRLGAWPSATTGIPPPATANWPTPSPA